jgi:hypothetical protein
LQQHEQLIHSSVDAGGDVGDRFAKLFDMRDSNATILEAPGGALRRDQIS